MGVVAKSSLFPLSTKDAVVQVSGVTLTRDQMLVMKLVETHSGRPHAERLNFFGATPIHFESLRMPKETILLVLDDLIKLKLVAQLFVTHYEAGKQIHLAPIFVSLSDYVTNVDSVYFEIIKKTIDNYHNFACDLRVIYSDPLKKAIIEQNALSGKKNKEDLDLLFDLSRFSLKPDPEFLNRSKKLIQEGILNKENVIYLPGLGVYILPEEEVFKTIQFARFYLESKAIPMMKKENDIFVSKIAEVEAEEETYELIPEHKETFKFLEKKVTIVFTYPDLVEFTKSELYLQLLKQTIPRGEKILEKRFQQMDQKSIELYRNMLDKGYDFDAKFLRINSDLDPNATESVIQNLHADSNYLSSVWYESKAEILVFSKKDLNTLRSINNDIYKNYRQTTEHILLFRSLIEKNEASVKAIFQDPEFVRLYGKNLEAVYLKYVPWYYTIAAWIGLDGLVGTAFVKAKSIITYQQMERKFKIEQQKKEAKDKKIEEHKEKREAEKRQKNKEILANAIDELITYNQKIPTIKELLFFIPSFNFDRIKETIETFNFQVVTQHSLMDENSIVVYPNSEEYFDKIHRLKMILSSLLKTEMTEPAMKILGLYTVS